MRTISKHYIDGAFFESHGGEGMDLIDPTTEKVIGQVTLGATKRMRAAPLRLPNER